MAEKTQNTIVIDAENAASGRLASFVAKKLLQGETVAIVNSEKAVITGSRKNIQEKYLRLRKIGGSAVKGPFFPSSSEKILKRMIRGMLPYKKSRGSQALKRVKCYNGIPKEFESAKKIKSGKSKAKATTLKELSRKLKCKKSIK